MIYRWRSGSIHNVAPEVAAEVCQRLEQEGRLTAQELVNESRAEDAPLHPEFEWRDEVAAERYREEQARSVIRSIEIVSEEHEPVRAFVHLECAKPQYTAIHSVVMSSDSTELMLKNAVAEIKAFQRKYGALKEFAGLFQKIDEILSEIGVAC